MKFYIGSEADHDISHKKDEKVLHPRLVNIMDNSEFNIVDIKKPTKKINIPQPTIKNLLNPLWHNKFCQILWSIFFCPKNII